MKRLEISLIHCTNFKNYSEAQFQFGPRFNLLYGLNGTGKTNLLDSIYYTSVGKSYFTAHDQKVVRNGESFFRIEANVLKEDAHKVTIKVKPGVLKELSVDGVPLDRISDHVGFIPLVMSAPRDIDLVLGTSQSRRRYIDHLLCQLDPAYLQSLVAYNHLLQLRSVSLKQRFEDLKRMIDTYDQQMAPHATYIFEKRKWLIGEAKPLLRHAYNVLSEQREEVDIQYDSRLLEYNYLLLADMSWEADKNTERSNAGIHRDDFGFSIKGMAAKEYASQGQIKSFIFALHLSKHQILSNACGAKPLLILDDIFDKLDERRLARLLEVLHQSTFGQVFLSDTNRKRVAEFIRSDELHEIPIAG